MSDQYTTREQVLEVIAAGQVWVNDTYLLIVCPKDKEGLYPFMYRAMWRGETGAVRHAENWFFHEGYSTSPRSDAAGYIVNTKGVKMVDIGREYEEILARV